MARKPALIASDLDGTLLLNGKQSLSKDAPNIVRRIMDSGIIFVAASGRRYDNMQNLFSTVKDDIGYVTDNGCLAYWQGERIWRQTMELETGRKIIAALADVPGVKTFVAAEKSCYVDTEHKEFGDFMRNAVGFTVTVVDSLYDIGEPYMKISAYEEGGLTDTAHWKELFGDTCTVQTGGFDWLDMIPAGANKGAAMAILLDKLGISAADCIMFGDNENDREILSLVGCPITMTTAVEGIKPLGKYHTDNVEKSLKRILDGEGYEW